MDLSSRYGAEEFVTVLSGGNVFGGIQFAESVRAGLAIHGAAVHGVGS